MLMSVQYNDSSHAYREESLKVLPPHPRKSHKLLQHHKQFNMLYQNAKHCIKVSAKYSEYLSYII